VSYLSALEMGGW